MEYSPKTYLWLASVAAQLSPPFPHHLCSRFVLEEPDRARLRALLFAGPFINSGISHLKQGKLMAEYARASTPLARAVPLPIPLVEHQCPPRLCACG